MGEPSEKVRQALPDSGFSRWRIFRRSIEAKAKAQFPSSA
jgi:hypothetical protein